MTDRSVTARLGLDVTRFVAAARQARSEMSAVTGTIKSSSRDFHDLGLAAGAAGAAIAVGLGKAVTTAMDFDQQMSAVRAATHATADTMGLLRDAALDAGARTAFSATEAAAAIENLAKAGLSSEVILGGALAGSLDLAAAGGLEVADAAEIAATALTQFRLEGGQAVHVADLLAAGAGKAQGLVQDLALALNYAGVPAASLGESIEGTVGTLALFAKAGIVGERAGTSLRSMIESLANPSDEAKEKMAELGLEFFDLAGNFVGFDGVAKQLNRSLGDASEGARAQALAVMFGAQAMQAANVLTNEGAEGVRRWTKEVNDQGYAAETAALKLDNLAGDLEELRGSLETALIGGGSQATGVLRSLTQSATDTVNAFAAMPDTAQAAFMGVGALTGGTSLLGGAFLVLLPRIQETRAALAKLSASAPMLATGLSLGAVAIGGLGIAAATAGIIINEFTAHKRRLREATDELTSALEQEKAGVEGATTAWMAHRIAQADVEEDARKAGVAFDTVIAAIKGNKAALDEIRQLAKSGPAEGSSWTPIIGTDQEKAAANVLSQVELLSDAWRLSHDEMEKTAALEKKVGGTTDDLAGKQAGLASGLELVGGAAQGATDPLRAYRDALTDLYDQEFALASASQPPGRCAGISRRERRRRRHAAA